MLRALGISEDLAHSSLRFGIGRFNSQEEIDYVADLVVRSVEQLREISGSFQESAGDPERRAS